MRGYFFVAVGKKYIDECFLLSQTIRKQNDNLPISLLINPEDEEYARSLEMFDQLIHFIPHRKDKMWKSCETGFEKYGVYTKISLERYIPYEENIFLDSDVLCQYDTTELWNFLSNQSSSIVMLGRHDDPNWHWGSIREVSEAFGKHVSHVHSGFIYLRRDFKLINFFTKCKEIFHKYDEYKCKRAFRGGKADEIIFAIAYSHFNLSPIEFDSIPIMTFNYTPDMEIPSKLQTEGGQNINLPDYIPFVHMFDKMGGSNFTSLYNKIMEK